MWPLVDIVEVAVSFWRRICVKNATAHLQDVIRFTYLLGVITEQELSRIPTRYTTKASVATFISCGNDRR